MSKRVVVYVDGYFYSGLKASHWRKYYWLDLVSFFSKFLRPHQILQGIDYFSSTPFDKDRKERQQRFFLANTVDPRFKLHLGALERRRIFCNKCQAQSTIYVEKESDLRMASSMIADVVHDRCDISLLVSGDRDFLSAIQTIHELKQNHKVVVCFPPNRKSYHLKGQVTAM